MGVRALARATPASPALCARKEVQLGSGTIHEFRGDSRGVLYAGGCVYMRARTYMTLCALNTRETFASVCLSHSFTDTRTIYILYTISGDTLYRS